MATAEMVPEAIVPKKIISEPGIRREGNPTSFRLLPREQQPQNIVVIPVSVSVELVKGQAPSARPPQLLFGGLRHPNFRLRKPIPLRTEEEEGTVSVAWEDIQEFGYGGTLSEALSDFAATVTELLISLSREDSPLSNDLSTVREKLAEYIERRQR